MADEANSPAGEFDDENRSTGEPGGKESGPDILRVIDRLVIGPPRVEPRRFEATYSVHQNGEVYENELIYRFEEDVFGEDKGSFNLACMMAAQVALNYGLFCDEIVFHGLFDKHDMRFIKEMARNTAREILVKKFLEPNPFLKGEAARLSAPKQKDYLQAKIIFEQESGLKRSFKPSDYQWDVQRGSHAILSSGGKDSLLTYGLLREIGADVHPVFINESGRHWFTALNAHRYFSKNVPNSTRVWTNSDRIFSWMLRRFPFIRQDFANVRSDEYPIRLWTVAVFLFGALPLLRKRKVGRLLIGDEFDTSVKLKHKGIPHFDGLYDQSRYFDDALSDYFLRKKWSVMQFSILRPLSELFIEKILFERYPELLRHQVSCHAAHKEGERVVPCGRCEKCRRIVGMLTAIGADPSKSGYTKEGIANCLNSLVEKGVHQEKEGAAHMLYLLRERGIIPEARAGKTGVHGHPETLNLRFHTDKSPMNAIPSDLRKPLYAIYMEHGLGALKRVGQRWVAFDPFSDPGIHEHYRYEIALRSPSMNGAGPDKAHGTIYLLGELTWPEARERFKEVDLAILPVGSIEQHGPHLPLDTDAFDADYLARRVAQGCKDPKPIVLPLIPYGVSYHHDDFSGTISVSPETLSKLVHDVGMSAARNGIKKLVILNGHGGNSPALHFAAQTINKDAHIFTCVDTGETSDVDVSALAETDNDVHAGEIETSTSLAIRPHLVRMEKAQKFVPRFSNKYLDFTSRRSVGWYTRTAHISPNGVLGDATCATKEKGDAMWDVMIRRLVEFIEDLKVLSLEEIYQRKY